MCNSSLAGCVAARSRRIPWSPLFENKNRGAGRAHSYKGWGHVDESGDVHSHLAKVVWRWQRIQAGVSRQWKGSNTCAVAHPRQLGSLRRVQGILIRKLQGVPLHGSRQRFLFNLPQNMNLFEIKRMQAAKPTRGRATSHAINEPEKDPDPGRPLQGANRSFRLASSPAPE